MKISFDEKAPENKKVVAAVEAFLNDVPTAEKDKDIPVYVYQDGVRKSYYIRCTVSAATMAKVISLNARLDPESDDTFRDNRSLLLRHNTFIRMLVDAGQGREFSDIIAEYVTTYEPDKPLKVWGGQHRSRAIIDAFLNDKVSRYHGFRVYFCLSKQQRTELALVSNTNIAVSNDLFDRQLEETMMGPHLRKWCIKVGLLRPDEDFPDVGSRSDGITTQGARSFIINYFRGLQKGAEVAADQIDRNIYEPYLCQSGIILDEEYRKLIEEKGEAMWADKGLLEAGKAFVRLHREQSKAIRKSKLDRRSYRNKALIPSVISAWSYVAGFLQKHPERLKVHLEVPPLAKDTPDPLNAVEMARFRYYQDPENQHGLGTRASLKDRQRMAQVFLARTLDGAAPLDRKLLAQAVNQVTALRFFSKGYAA